MNKKKLKIKIKKNTEKFKGLHGNSGDTLLVKHTGF